MAGRKSYGRAFPIKEADVGSYRMVDRPNSGRARSAKPNPMGVTAITSVNGRGARSARSASQNRSRAERVQLGRSMMGNGGAPHRASFVKKMRSNRDAGTQRRSGKRLAAYQSARKRGLSDSSAARSAVRQVPFTQTERKGGASFKGVRQRPNGKKGKTVRTAARKNARRATPNRRRSTTRTRTVRANRRTKKSPTKKKTTARRTSGKRKTTKRTTRKTTRRAPARKTAARKTARKAAPRKTARKSPTKRKTTRRTKRRTGGFGEISKAAKAAKASSRRQKRLSAFPKQYREIQKKRTVKKRVAFGPYRRAKLVNPETGRSEYSFMYRGPSGKLRKIPAWAIAGALSKKDMQQVLKGKAGTKSDQDAIKSALAGVRSKRQKRAGKVLKRGSVFTPNASAAQRRAGRRTSKFLQFKRDGMTVSAAAREAVRMVPFTKTEEETGKEFKGVNNKDAGVSKVARKKRTTKKTSRRRSTRRRTTGARKRRSTKGRRKTAGKRKASRRKSSKRTTSRRRKPTRRKTTRRKSPARRKTTRRKSPARRKTTRRRTAKRNGRRAYAANRRRARPNRRRRATPNRRRRMKSNRRRYRRNQGFASDLKRLLKTGSLILGGFVLHRAVTGFACTMVPMPAAAAWQKPICGGVVMGLGILGVNSLGKGIKPETRAAINGGMAVSFLQQLAVSVATAMGQPQLLTYLEGYPHSTAYRLRGVRGMRGMRGMGQMERHATSIMPQYTPVGQYRQAAAGTRGVGEYFASNAMGEYFANKGLQGVGHYEKAGPLALQPNRATGEIEDGIRPDSNLDDVLTLAESAAGLGQGYRQAAAGFGQYRQAAAGMRGLGEFFAASPANGGFSEYRVPTSSQWIPNGPLWAGTMSAGDTPTESEIPAGILQGPGGNGILSGG